MIVLAYKENAFMAIKDITAEDAACYAIRKLMFRIERKLTEEYEGRKSDIITGAETKRLSALLFRKYASGLIDSLSELAGTPRVTDQIQKIADRMTSEIDPDWKSNDKERWNMKLVDIHQSSQ